MIINTQSIKCSIYLILYVIYRILSVVYPGTIASKAFLLIFMLISIYYTAKSLRLLNNCDRYIKYLFILIILFTIYGFIYFLSSNSYVITESVIPHKVSKIEYLKNIYLSLLPIFPFYYWSSKCLISERWIRNMSILLLAQAIFIFTYSYRDFVINDEYGRTEMTNNYGYALVALFPLLCFWSKKRIVQLIYMTILLIYIIISMKRGAILIGVICSLYFLITIFCSVKLWGKVGLLSILAIGLYIGIPILLNYIETKERFQQRIQLTIEGDSSNRDMLYYTGLQHVFNETTLSEFIFGTGADSSIAVLTNYAHNDWIEIGINQGVLGIVIYILYFISFFKLWISRKNKDYLKASIGLCFIICFISTFFSMSYNSMDISLSLSIGYMLAVSRNDKIVYNKVL